MPQSGRADERLRLLAVDDIGIPGEGDYTMTAREGLEDNDDLVDFCTRLLAAT